MKREANPGKPTISSPLNERERQDLSLPFKDWKAPPGVGFLAFLHL
jgi:hypothetical protein